MTPEQAAERIAELNKDVHEVVTKDGRTYGVIDWRDGWGLGIFCKGYTWTGTWEQFESQWLSLRARIAELEGELTELESENEDRRKDIADLIRRCEALAQEAGR